MDFSILSIILLTSTLVFSATTVILALSLRKYQNLFFAEQVNSRKIVDEYEYLVDRYKVKQIGFVDPIFPLVKKDLKPLCDEIVAGRKWVLVMTGRNVLLLTALI